MREHSFYEQHLPATSSPKRSLITDNLVLSRYGSLWGSVTQIITKWGSAIVVTYNKVGWVCSTAWNHWHKKFVSCSFQWFLHFRQLFFYTVPYFHSPAVLLLSWIVLVSLGAYSQGEKNVHGNRWQLRQHDILFYCLENSSKDSLHLQRTKRNR